MRLPRYSKKTIQWAGATLVFGIACQRHATDLPPPLASQFEVAELGRNYPAQVVAGFTQGETAAKAGRLAEAAASFSNTLTLAPRCGLLFRRSCEVLTELGRRDEALAACEKAAIYGQDVADLRAKARALMSGPNKPSHQDFLEAYQIGGGIRRRMAHRTEGHAAMFDIAYRLNDRKMMLGALGELEKIDPNHHDTQRARILIDRSSSSRDWRFQLGWLLLLGMCGLTVARALRNVRARSAIAPSPGRL